MRLEETSRFALRGVDGEQDALRAHALGIIIGVAAVIVLVAVGRGSSRRRAGPHRNRSARNPTSPPCSRRGGFGGSGRGGRAAAAGRSAERHHDQLPGRSPTRDAGDHAQGRQGARHQRGRGSRPGSPRSSTPEVTATYDGASHDVNSLHRHYRVVPADRQHGSTTATPSPTTTTPATTGRSARTNRRHEPLRIEVSSIIDQTVTLNGASSRSSACSPRRAHGTRTRTTS